jgi:hypothetical protein
MGFHEACEFLENVLRGNTRSQILDYVCLSKTTKDALAKLRSAIRAHSFKTKNGEIHLTHPVRVLDERTKEDGFHVLIDWDGKANRWLGEMIPVDVLDYYARGVDPLRIDTRARQSLSILLDYYFLYVLALLAMRVGDEGSTSANVDRVQRLIAELQGPSGSGHQFVENTATLVLIATSHFEPDEAAYERLIERIRTTWSESQRLTWALEQLAVLGSHLRHGFQDLYMRDIGLMRADNSSDYPCLCVALLIAMRAYSRLHGQRIVGTDRDRVVEGLFNGLTPDARAFISKRPASLEKYAADQKEFSELFARFAGDLLKEFDVLRPSERRYSALAFSFNFPHNVVKGTVIDAIFKGEPNLVPVDWLLSGVGAIDDRRQMLARTLMGYSRQVPDKIGGRAVPVIAYDPAYGLRTFTKTISLLRELAPPISVSVDTFRETS